jgi:hypothetical protein
LVPMDDAISAIGEEKAQNAAMHVSISRRSLLPAMLRGR